MRIEIDELGSVGLVRDIFNQELPPQAWTQLQNARMGPLGAEVFLGHSRILGTGSAGWAVPPYWLFFVPVAGGSDFWLGAGQQKVYARLAASPNTETNITRQSAGVDVNYSATETEKWNGGYFGGPMVLNNGVDEPQVWSPTAAATKLANLSTVGVGAAAWPSTYRARCMRPYGRFLVGINILKGSTRYPQLIKWSHPADPGSLPSSWDETNPAVDAGEFPLNDAYGDLVDQLVLRSSNILYTTGDVWAMTWVGGNNVFRFDRLFNEQGALYTNCVAAFKKNTEFHAVLAGDDIYVHNGQSPQSILSPKNRKWFFQQLSTDYYERSFVVANPLFNEIWVCIPENGAEQPSLALVWNWETGAVGFRELLQSTSNGDTRTTAGTKGTPAIVLGKIDDVSTETWDSDSGSWDTDITPWDARTSNPATARLLMVDRSASKRTFLADSSAAFDTAAVSWTFARESLAAFGKDGNGKPKIAGDSIKLLTEIWPRIDGVAGTEISVEVGLQDRPEDPVDWQPAYTFVVGEDLFIPAFYSARFLSFRFSGSSTSALRMLGYGLEVNSVGVF